ncbi:hypothetical protein HPB49_021288 [Dermacentor silvarum]|uniref:Uncharacterized protein n=1 Tax=Dermacentor silvarum TaxID=543639 RepID=A0ACB8D831_DERSI|nr:hypothetical protein HPB49_021288 [Dermacentor silvarum]
MATKIHNSNIIGEGIEYEETMLIDSEGEIDDTPDNNTEEDGGYDNIDLEELTVQKLDDTDIRIDPKSATTSNAVAAAVQVQRDVQPEYDGTLEDKTTAADKTPDNVEPRNPETMDFSQEAAALTAGKRSREEFVGKKQEPGGGSDEPPPKTPGIRRSDLKPLPNLAAETRQADKPPP